MNKHPLIMLLFLFFCCCKKNQSVQDEYQPIVIPCTLSKNLDTARLYIQGTWQWLEEKRADRVQQKFVYLTPQNQGYTLTMELYNDSARFFKNNQPDSVFTYKIILEKEITTVSEDTMPVISFYRLSNNVRAWYVPLSICPKFLQLQYQYVTSIGGQQIWKKQ